MRLLARCTASTGACTVAYRKRTRREHVAEVGLRDSNDDEVWNFALAHDPILVTKDEDFPSRVWIDRASPGIIWVTIGNCSNRTLIAVFEQQLPAIERIFSVGKSLVQIQKTRCPDMVKRLFAPRCGLQTSAAARAIFSH